MKIAAFGLSLVGVIATSAAFASSPYPLTSLASCESLIQSGAPSPDSLSVLVVQQSASNGDITVTLNGKSYVPSTEVSDDGLELTAIDDTAFPRRIFVGKSFLRNRSGELSFIMTEEGRSASYECVASGAQG